MSFWLKWIKFLFPVKGWKNRYRSFMAGQKAWPVPGRPDVPYVVPFPIEWIPHQILPPGHGSDSRNIFQEGTPDPIYNKSQENSIAEDSSVSHPIHDSSSSEAEEEPKDIGFIFLDATCIDSGQRSPVGVGVLCCRCGVPLHPQAAHMFNGFDPPMCRRCRPLIRIFG